MDEKDELRQLERQAQEKLSNGRHEEAIRILTDCSVKYLARISSQSGSHSSSTKTTINEDRSRLARVFESTASCHEKLAVHDTSKLNQAVAFHEKCLELRKKVADKKGAASSYAQLANCHFSLGHYSKSIELQNKCLEIRKKLDDLKGIAKCYVNLGNCYFFTGQYHTAVDCNQKAITMKEKDGDTKGLVKCYTNLGNCYKALGMFAKAAECQELALAKVDPSDKKLVAATLSHLASCHRALGRYGPAIDHAERAHCIMKEIGDKRGTASVLGIMSSCHRHLGQIQTAIDHLKTALSLLQEVSDERGKIPVLGNLATCYELMGELHTAISYQRQALTIAAEFDDKRSIAAAHGQLASCHRALKEYESAKDELELCLSTMFELDDKKGIASAYANLADCHMCLGDMETSVMLQESALETRREVGDMRGSVQSLQLLGRCALKQGQWEKAETLLIEAMEIGEKMRSSLGKGPEMDQEKVSLSETLSYIFQDLQIALISQNKFLRALTIAERGRASALAELLEPFGGNRQRPPSSFPSLSTNSISNASSVFSPLASPLLIPSDHNEALLLSSQEIAIAQTSPFGTTTPTLTMGSPSPLLSPFASSSPSSAQSQTTGGNGKDGCDSSVTRGILSERNKDTCSPRATEPASSTQSQKSSEEIVVKNNPPPPPPPPVLSFGAPAAAATAGIFSSLLGHQKPQQQSSNPKIGENIFASLLGGGETKKPATTSGNSFVSIFGSTKSQQQSDKCGENKNVFAGVQKNSEKLFLQKGPPKIGVVPSLLPPLTLPTHAPIQQLSLSGNSGDQDRDRATTPTPLALSSPLMAAEVAPIFVNQNGGGQAVGAVGQSSQQSAGDTPRSASPFSFSIFPKGTETDTTFQPDKADSDLLDLIQTSHCIFIEYSILPTIESITATTATNSAPPIKSPTNSDGGTNSALVGGDLSAPTPTTSASCTPKECLYIWVARPCGNGDSHEEQKSSKSFPEFSVIEEFATDSFTRTTIQLPSNHSLTFCKVPIPPSLFTTSGCGLNSGGGGVGSGGCQMQVPKLHQLITDLHRSLAVTGRSVAAPKDENDSDSEFGNSKNPKIDFCYHRHTTARGLMNKPGNSPGGSPTSETNTQRSIPPQSPPSATDESSGKFKKSMGTPPSLNSSFAEEDEGMNLSDPSVQTLKELCSLLITPISPVLPPPSLSDPTYHHHHKLYQQKLSSPLDDSRRSPEAVPCEEDFFDLSVLPSCWTSTSALQTLPSRLSSLFTQNGEVDLSPSRIDELVDKIFEQQNKTKKRKFCSESSDNEKERESPERKRKKDESNWLMTTCETSEIKNEKQTIVSTEQPTQNIFSSFVGIPPSKSIQNENEKSIEFEKKLSSSDDDLVVDVPMPVVIVPQDSLNLLCFPALFQLVENQGGGSGGGDKQQIATIDRFPIVIAPSMRVHKMVCDAAGSKKVSLKTDPILELGDGNSIRLSLPLASSGSLSQQQVLIVGNPTFCTLANGAVPCQLPGSQRESNHIAKLLQTPAVIGPNATKDFVLERLEKARILHFATHCLVDEVDVAADGKLPGALLLAPPSSYSGVDLSVAGNVPNDSVMLRARELVGKRLQAEIVCLSACDSGYGKVTKDGVVGLARSFIAAGASTVVVSLWKVHDEATEYLMKRFYKHLLRQGLRLHPQADPVSAVCSAPKAFALQQAMKDTKKKFSHPSLWSAFFMLGKP